MGQSISLRQAALIVLFFALVQLGLQMTLLARGVEYAAVSLAIDDTYYYLQTAWNTKLLGFVTFDGLHSTNGVQLLWFCIILLLATLAKTKTAKRTMLSHYPKARRAAESAGIGTIHGRLMVAAKPSVPNLFDGHGKFVTRPGILVRYLAKPALSDSGAAAGETKFLGFDGRSHSKRLDSSRFGASLGRVIYLLCGNAGVFLSKQRSLILAAEW
jgi:hypothetical protein